MIHVENVYEEILHQSLLDETLKGEEDLLGAEGTSGTGDPVSRLGSSIGWKGKRKWLLVCWGDREERRGKREDYQL